MNQFFNTKEEITHWLDSHGVENYSLLPDTQYGYVVNVQGSVNLDNQKLDFIPVKFGLVEGHFECQRNWLSSLAFSPYSVGRNFNCSYNRLTSLEGGLDEVGKDFYCSDNRLTTLVGGPKKVGSHYYCLNNRLSNLVGAPVEINGQFVCRKNKLTSLLGSPQIITSDFDCERNQLTSLEYCPKEIHGALLASHNNIENLIYFPQKIGSPQNSFLVFLDNNSLLGNLQTVNDFFDFLPYHQKQAFEKNVQQEKINLEQQVIHKNEPLNNTSFKI